MSSPRAPREADRGTRPCGLAAELAQVLPKDFKFQVHHLSTPPTNNDALYYPPAQPSTIGSSVRPTKPLKTFCEKHFLAVSIDSDKDATNQVLAFALEIYVFTTTFSTTIFVAKADSTGYLSLMNLPKGTPSPIREVSVVFLNYLVAHRKRPSKQLVVNLFARSQSQYLFPGSVKNTNKHILDDRGLVKWWCRVLNPLVEPDDQSKTRRSWGQIRGYLVIPGLDDYETRAFLPRTSSAAKSWTVGDPLERISPYCTNPAAYGHNIPPRCVIPMFPDDPKARFLTDLEESTPQKVKLMSGWKSPKTLSQFWEMLAFRQECSSGRMTGFVWIVFDPRSASQTAQKPTEPGIRTPTASFSAPAAGNSSRPVTPERNVSSADALTTPTSTPAKSVMATPKKPRRRKAAKKKKKKTGLIVTRRAQVKTHNRVKLPDRIDTPYFFWPEQGRGQVILDDNGYKRAVELLLHLEFSNLESAIASTARWVNEVKLGEKWDLQIVGERALEPSSSGVAATASSGAVNNLSAGLVKRKRATTETDTKASATPVNTLGASAIRKKPKTVESEEATTATKAADETAGVNVLTAGLVRKKAKPS